MASSTLSRSEEQFLCSICLDVFSEPVSTPCGHNFCQRCISQTWDTNTSCFCPLCKEVFSIRPQLRKNTFISEMVSQWKLEAEVHSKQKSKPVEVFCDVCSDPKLKAVKSCLVCESSFCESHLQPHLSVPGLKKHQLMEPVDNMEDRICPTHNQPLQLFCHTEKKTICVLCSVLEHKNHQYMSLQEAVEQEKTSLQETVAENQRLLQQRRQKVQEIQRSLDLSEKENQREVAVGLQVFTVIIQSVQKQLEQFLQQLQEKQKSNQRQAQDLLHQLQQEMKELQKNSCEAQQLCLSTDALHFLQQRSALPPVGLKELSSLNFRPQTSEGSTARALSQLEKLLPEEFQKAFRQVELESKKKELRRVKQFAVDLTLDPDTAHPRLALSEDLKQVYCGDVKKQLPDSPQRFDYCPCVLGKQSFSSGSFYFEVQVKGESNWDLGVARESINRKGGITETPQNGFWTIWLRNGNEYKASHPPVPVSPQRPPQKVGVFVDYGAGLVSFYDADSSDLLYSFTGCSFKDKLLPFFSPCIKGGGTNSAPLIISAVETEERG